MSRNQIEVNRPRRTRPGSPSSQPVSASPFMDVEPVRMTFTVVLLLLFMFLAAGIAGLFRLALNIPEFSAELSNWLGVSVKSAAEDSRRHQLYFALALYAAPLGFGLLVAFIHMAINYLVRLTSQSSETDERFRME